jgi:Receptor family ligand binding region
MYSILLFLQLVVVGVDTELYVPGLVDRQYPVSRVQEADVNVGFVVSIHQTADNDSRCAILMPSGVLQSLAMQFAVQEINARQDLLPNVTLGFVHVDDCWDSLRALQASVYFIEDYCTGSSRCNVSGAGVDSLESFHVVGIIGPEDSGTSVTISPFLGTFEIPQMAVYATANALSDKAKYPFFMRLVPAESGQQHMLLEVMFRLCSLTNDRFMSFAINNCCQICSAYQKLSCLPISRSSSAQHRKRSGKSDRR